MTHTWTASDILANFLHIFTAFSPFRNPANIVTERESDVGPRVPRIP